jgi:hypothetical protein
MTTYTYAQLEGLWEQAGGSSALAPVMAAIALAESGGNSNAYNASGATGLWQILGAVNASDQSSLTNPAVNAKEAVLKYNSQGLGAWATYTSGAYKQYLQSGTTAVTTALDNQNVVADTSTAGNTPVPASSLGTSSVISQASGLLKDVATVLDYIFGMFGRGQGWRTVFTLVAGVSLYGSYKCLVSAGVVPNVIPNTVVI